MKDKMISQELLEILGEPQEAITHEHTSDNEGEKEVFLFFERAAELFSTCMNDYLYVWDLEHDVYYITERAVARFDLPSNVFQNVDEVHKRVVHPDDYNLLLTDMSEMRSGRKSWHNLRYRWMSVNQEPVWINCQGRTIRSEDGKVFLMIGCINEIGEKKKADNVSGLLGEVTFQEQIKQFHKMPRCYILRLGIDDFKNINETLGIGYGDHVLFDVATCITDCLEPGQAVYRMTSDEFVVFDLISKTKEDAKALYSNIRYHVAEHIKEHEYEALYTLSCGVISDADLETLDYEQITKLSQFSLSRAKERGKNQLVFFDREDYDTFVANRQMTRNLRKAVSKEYQGFELYFQPIMRVGSEEIFAAEALLRYRDAEGTLIPPYRFIDQLEESGLIVPVGRWIIDTALRACVECQKIRPDFKVSINFSYVQILKSSVYEDLTSAIEKYHLKPESVIVELTENGYLARNSNVTKLWRKLKEYGVQMALDDFGTGYSNLINLSQMQPDILKIDREFTCKALNSDYEHQLLKQIIEMVHSLNIKEVVEGIEEKDELDRITAMGPDYIQGYYYSKPCPIDDFMDKFIDKE